MNRTHLQPLTLLTALVVGFASFTTAHAQSGAAIALGETDLIPAIRFDYSSNSNTFRTDENPVTGTQVTVSPSLDWVATRRLLTFSVDYRGSYALASDNVLDFVDHRIRAKFDAEFSSRHRTSASLTFSKDHNDIGEGILTNASEGSTNEVAEFNNIELKADHTFGAQNAIGNIRGGTALVSRDYTNLDQFTLGRGYTLLDVFGEFGYRVSADTRALLGVRFRRIDSDTDRRDRNEITVYTGARFSATGKISGSIQLGVTQGIFDATDLTDTTLLSVDGEIGYLFSDFSKLNLTAAREIDNARGSLSDFNGATPVTTELSLQWERAWSSRITSVIGADVEIFTAECSTSEYQEITPSIEVTYAVRRWLSFGASGSQQSRSVSDCAEIADADELNDFDRSDVSVFVNATL